MLREKKKHYIKPPKRIRSIQQALPAAKIHASGVMEIDHLYSSSYRLKDVDFSSGSEDDQEEFFRQFESLLNGFDGRTTTFKLTLFKHKKNYLKTDFLLLPTDCMDGYDQYRVEYNSIRRHNRAQAQGYVIERYLTVTAERKNLDLAEEYFRDFGKDFSERLKRIDSSARRLNIQERMQIFYDFYSPGMEDYYAFDFEAAKKRRTSWRDYVCPDELQFKFSKMRLHNRYARVLFLRDWGSSLKVETLSRLMNLTTNIMISVDIVPLTPETTRRYLDDSEMAADANLDRWHNRPGADRKSFRRPPFRYIKDQKTVEMYNEDVEERNQKIFLANAVIVVQAETEEQLESYTQSLEATAGECGCQIQTMMFRQMAGLNTVLPYGPRYIQNLRDVTTENLAALMPFDSVAVNHITGIPYGVHEETRQEMLIDRRLLLNGNEWLLGVPGSGKSMRVKLTAFFEIMLTPGSVIFIDPHGEYTHLTKALGGQVITFGGDSKDVINAMDMNHGYGDGDDLKKKMEFVVALFHAALSHEFTKAMEAIVMRCTQRVFYTYSSQGFKGSPPTLQTLYDEIKKQPESVAQVLALLMEPMLIGPMSCFNGQSNAILYNRITCFDISRMDQSVWDAGMTVIMDTIQNRLALNNNASIPTYIKIDEVGRFLNDPYLSHLFERFYSESRKWGGYITGIVQNVNKLLHTEAARNMLSNSEIVVMFRQSSIDVPELTEMYRLSDKQADKLLSAEEGCGLFKCGNQIINFDGRIEKGLIYDLANTKPEHNY